MFRLDKGLRAGMVATRTGYARSLIVGLAVTTLALAGCGGSTSEEDSADGTTEISIWAHQGQPGEVNALQSAVSAFNSSQSAVKATLKLIPENDYTKSVTAANPEELPDVLEVDGPTVASLVYNKKLAPIEGSIAPATKKNALPSILAQGVIDGKLYALGMFDSGLGIWGNRKLLAAAGVKYPTKLTEAWTAEQFTAALKALAAKDPDRKVLDIKENYGFGAGSEWTTYGFSPIVWSAGGNLIANGKSTGVLNTPTVAGALTTVQLWKRYVDSNTKDDAFTSGKVALSWVGHWVYPTYRDALKDDLVLLPLPDFGNGPKTGQGSWAWGISAKSAHPKAAGAFVDYLLNDTNVAAMTTANGAPPGTKSATAASNLYRAGGPLQMYADGLAMTCGAGALIRSCVAVVRPVTAGYPIVTQQFAAAFKDIYGGADVQASLDKAAKGIDTDFADNDGYQLS